LDEVLRHKVRLTRDFEIGKYEVTQAQWESVMGPGSNPSKTN
jgi:formylglycine-generating enzyme required for sulfatase activity